MMKTHKISIENKSAEGYEIGLPGAPLLVAQGSKGFIMCGYLDINTANRLGHAAAVVRGVMSIDELLDKAVSDVSEAAKKLGVASGMSGRQALQKLI
jgi:uncharacterized protein YunC (DUF1805 family)